MTSLPDSCVTRQRGHRNGSEERKALTCEKGEAVVVLVGWVASFCGFGRGARHRQPAMAVFCLAGSSLHRPLPASSQDYWKWNPTRLMSRLTSWAVGRPSPTTITIYSHSPTGHRLTAVYVTPDEHGHQSGGANTVEIQLKKVDMPSVFFLYSNGSAMSFSFVETRTRHFVAFFLAVSGTG